MDGGWNPPVTVPINPGFLRLQAELHWTCELHGNAREVLINHRFVSNNAGIRGKTFKLVVAGGLSRNREGHIDRLFQSVEDIDRYGQARAAVGDVGGLALGQHFPPATEKSNGAHQIMPPVPPTLASC